MKFEPAPVVWSNLVDCINWVPLYSGHLGACLHGGGGRQVGEVTHLGGVTRQSI